MITPQHQSAEERLRRHMAESHLFLCKKIGRARFCYLLRLHEGTYYLRVEYKDDEVRRETECPLPVPTASAAEEICRALAARRATPTTLSLPDGTSS